MPPPIPRQRGFVSRSIRKLIKWSCMAIGAIVLIVVLAVALGKVGEEQLAKVRKEKAQELQRERENRHAKIASLCKELEVTDRGTDRITKLRALAKLDPTNEKYQVELKPVIERLRLEKNTADEFISSAVGKELPLESSDILGDPEVIKHDVKHSTYYLAKADISFAYHKASGKIVFADYGRSKATAHLATLAKRRRSEIEKQFSSWDGSHASVVKHIKNSMHDSSSYKHLSTKYIDQETHLLVICEFRGTNAFGATVKNKVVAEVDLSGKLISIK